MIYDTMIRLIGACRFLSARFGNTYIINGCSERGLNAVLRAELVNQPETDVCNQFLLEYDRQQASGEIEREYGQD